MPKAREIKTNSKPLESNLRISKRGADRSKPETLKKKETSRQELKNCRTRNKTFEGNQRISTNSRELENKAQTARKELEKFRKSKPLEIDQRTWEEKTNHSNEYSSIWKQGKEQSAEK